MPKNRKRVKQNEEKADDFYAMLAEFQAAVPTTAKRTASKSTTSTASIPSLNDTNSSTGASQHLRRVPVRSLVAPDVEKRDNEEDAEGDVTKWRCWGRLAIGDKLSLAALNGRDEVLRSLVQDLGADVSKSGEDGVPPLAVAAFRGHLAAVLCLVNELGADLNQVDKWKRTALHLAVLGRHFHVVSSLLELRADVNKADRHGITPLILASIFGDLDVVRSLLDSRADINARSSTGITSLIVASMYEHFGVVKWLLKAGADPKILASPPPGLLESLHSSRPGADISKIVEALSSQKMNALYFSEGADASTEQTAYLEAKTSCSNSDCSGAGIKKCTGCKQARYCGEACQLAHWKVHKADCKRWSADLEAGKGH
jgi:hypothetical protein